MNEIKVFKKLTFIELKNGDIRAVNEPKATIDRICEEKKFLNLWDESFNTSYIVKISEKELSDNDKVLYSIEDRVLRMKVEKEIKERIKEWKRVTPEIIGNLIQKLQENAWTNWKNWSNSNF